MAVAMKEDHDEEQVGLLEVNPPVNEDACSQRHIRNPVVQRPVRYSSARRAKIIWLIAQIIGLTAIWLLTLSFVGIFRHLFLWNPVVYSYYAAVVPVGILAGISWFCAVMWGFFLGDQLKREWICGLAVGAAFLSAIGILFVFIFGLEECAGDELRVFVRVVPGVSSLVTATVMLSASFDIHVAYDVLALQQFNGNGADPWMELGWVHGETNYALAYNLSSGTAHATDGSSATFTRDNNVEIAFADKTRPIVVDPAFRDISTYGGGERVLRRMGTAKGCSALKFCAAKFAPHNSTGIRARARVLYPLGLQMRDFADGPRC